VALGGELGARRERFECGDRGWSLLLPPLTMRHKRGATVLEQDPSLPIKNGRDMLRRSVGKGGRGRSVGGLLAMLLLARMSREPISTASSMSSSKWNPDGTTPKKGCNVLRLLEAVRPNVVDRARKGT
jgi:hypothetical protein